MRRNERVSETKYQTVINGQIGFWENKSPNAVLRQTCVIPIHFIFLSPILFSVCCFVIRWLKRRKWERINNEDVRSRLRVGLSQRAYRCCRHRGICLAQMYLFRFSSLSSCHECHSSEKKINNSDKPLAGGAHKCNCTTAKDCRVCNAVYLCEFRARRWKHALWWQINNWRLMRIEIRHAFLNCWEHVKKTSGKIFPRKQRNRSIREFLFILMVTSKLGSSAINDTTNYICFNVISYQFHTTHIPIYTYYSMINW